MQILKDPVQDSVLGPAVQPGVDGVPVAELGRQASPLAAVFSYIQDCVEHLQIGKADVAALYRQAVGNALVLFFKYNLCSYSVNRP